MSTQIVNSNFDANVQEGQTAKYNLITKVCRRPFMSFALLAFFLIGKFPGNLLNFSAKVVQKKVKSWIQFRILILKYTESIVEDDSVENQKQDAN